MKNLKYIPTKKLQEILNEPYCRGQDGVDYGPYLEELQQILWQRLTKLDEQELKELEELL